jgi:hypothetical protein
MPKHTDQRFKTHIAEPRWQQIVSIIVAVGFLGFWAYLIFFAK